MIFDIIVIVIFITVFITGFIRGAGIELLRFLKLVIPFIVLYYFGDLIIHELFKTDAINYFVYTVLPDIPFKSTISSLSTQIMLYLFVYLIMSLILWRLGSLVLDERIEYFFGRTNAIMGGIFSVLWMYIIISYLIIPLYVLNLTSKQDFTTNFILNNPPPFSRVGQFINRSKPTLDQMNEMTNAFQVMDLDGFKNYSTFLTDVKSFVIALEKKSTQVYDALINEGQAIDVTKEEFLYKASRELEWFKELRVQDDVVNEVKKELEKEIETYRPVIEWAYEEDIFTLNSWDDMVYSFIENYDDIAFNTKDSLTIERFAETMTMSQIYLTMRDFLYETMGIEVETTKDLLEDKNLYILLEHYHQHEDQLLKRIDELQKFSPAHKKWFKSQVKRFGDFQEKYQDTYKYYIDRYENLLPDVSLRYKLVFAIMKAGGFDKTFYEHIERNPTLYPFVLDTIPFLNEREKEIDLYYQIGQVYVALFLIEMDENGMKGGIDPNRIFDQLKYHQYLLNEYSDLNKTINAILHALLKERDGTSYIEFLIDEEYMTIETLQSINNYDDVQKLLNRQNQAYVNRILERYEKEVAPDANYETQTK